MTPTRVLQVAWAVAVRPHLWATALVQMRRLARPGWWRRWPPVPVPDPAYVRFRTETAQGEADHVPEVRDVVAYLSWCRKFGRLS